MKTHVKLLLLLASTLLFTTCKKGHTWFATHITGNVKDYFSGNNVEGVTVALVYTYDFKPFKGCTTADCVEPKNQPDTLEKTTTDASGNFSLKFKPQRTMQGGGIADNVFNTPFKFGYLLIFYKQGTEYFKQYYIIENPNKKVKVNYQLKSSINISVHCINTSPSYQDDWVEVGVGSDFYDSGIIELYGQNIDTILNFKIKEYASYISFGCNYRNYQISGNDVIKQIRKEKDDLQKNNTYEFNY
jgi:hypothetical protein